MRLYAWPLLTLLLSGAFFQHEASAQGDPPRQFTPRNITWKKIVIDKNFRSEGVAVVDVNKDGRLDIIVGDCWYEAPKDPTGEWKRHILRDDRKFDPLKYSESFACFADDFNGDGYPDVIVIPFPGAACYWYENPGPSGGKWKAHLLTTSACNETPIYVDLFKTGKRILVMGWNPPKDVGDPKKGNYDDRGEMCYFLPGKDPRQPWQRISISGPSEKGKTIPGTARFSHGLGHGDVNDDGRIDVLCAQGWWEQPDKIDGRPWKFHAANISGPCADMYAFDVDGDGKADIVSTSAHNYGFWWAQQKDLNSFVQRSFFAAPAEVAKLPASYKFADEEKALIDAINQLRVNEFHRAPFAVHPDLCRMARGHAERLAKYGTKEANISGDYKGKVLVVRSQKFALPAPSTEKKDAKLAKNPKSPLHALALALLPDNAKDNDLVAPNFEIGVGAFKTETGEPQYTLIIGDRGLFSLPSQTHALHHVDIDGDGLKDLVTGRRWWAHGPKGDAGPNDPGYLYWFQAKKSKDGSVSFIPHLIDDDSGVGTQFAIADVNGDGIPDIVISNKRGVFLFLQIRTPALGKD